MMKRFSSGLALVLAVAFAAGNVYAEEGWVVDFEKAKATAAKEKKDVLMEFTGSDWCPPCKALHKNVLSTELFKESAPKMFVLLKLDNPRDKSKQSEEEIKQYPRLSSEYQVQGVPNIVLADAKGRPYARIVGYGGDKPEAWLEKIKNLQQVRVERDKGLKAAAGKKGIARAKSLDEALSGLSNDIIAGFYENEVAEIVKLDASGKAGLKEKYKVVFVTKELATAQTDYRAEMQKLMRAGKLNAETAAEAQGKLVARLDKLLEEKLKGSALQEVLYLKSSLVFRKDRKTAKKLLEEAKAAAPNTEKAEQIALVLERTFSSSEKKEEKKEEKKDDKKEEPKKEKKAKAEKKESKKEKK